MFKKAANTEKGIALFLVLSLILIVVAMANVILIVISSQARLTHHQVSRIQAHYAAQAGMNYAIEALRSGDWEPPTTFYTRSLTDSAFPSSIVGRTVSITVASRNASVPDVPGCNPCAPPAGVDICICTTANYTHTP